MTENTVYIGMDVHKDSFTVCCYTFTSDKAEYCIKVEPKYTAIIDYIKSVKKFYGEDAQFITGYEAGCLGYSLHNDLVEHGVTNIILAPTTMLDQRGKRVKTDARDAELIAKCLAHNEYSPVYVLTQNDTQVKSFIRMRDDLVEALKKIKQQILAFTMQRGYVFDGTKNNWTQAHVTWLRALKLEGYDQKTLEEYLLTYDYLTERLKSIENDIIELAGTAPYQKQVAKLKCLMGIKDRTALALVTEIGDFNRFPNANAFASFLGLTPGENSSGPKWNPLAITKAGNQHLRKLLIEAAQVYTRGKPGYKSRLLKSRQEGNDARVIQYADKCNKRLRDRYYFLVYHQNKKNNVAKVAIARELACFIWGLMTEHYD